MLGEGPRNFCFVLVIVSYGMGYANQNKAGALSMREQSGRENNNQKSAGSVEWQTPFRFETVWWLASVFVMLLALMMFARSACAATPSINRLTNDGAKKSVPVTASYRVAQANNSLEGWQSNAFRAMDIQKRLDRLSRLKRQQKPGVHKKRKSAEKRRALARLRKSKINKLKKTVKQPVQVATNNGQANTITIVREPVKLQRCLKTAGFFSGAITGRLDDATLLAYLAFREARNLQHRPNNLYDPVIQKILFAQCPDNSLSKLNQLVANAIVKKQTHVKVAQNVSLSRKGVTKTPIKKQVSKPDHDNAPLTTASIVVAKKQSRLPGMSSSDDKRAVSFATDVLVATDSLANPVVTSGKKDRPVSRQYARISGASSSFAVKRTPRQNTGNMMPVAGANPARVASSSPGLFSKPLMIKDLATVEPVNQNTCSPQKHGPVVAMSSPPAMSSVPVGQTVSSRSLKSFKPFKTARITDDGPMITGAISSSPGRNSLSPASANRSRFLQKVSDSKTCLPQDLYDLLVSTYGRNPAVSVCKPDCLPAPKAFSQGQRGLFARQYNINWCGTGCLGIADPLPLSEVMKIERQARVHVCMQPQIRLTAAIKKGLDRVGINSKIRSLYDRLPGGYGNKDNIAVIIGNRNYSRGLKVNDAGHVNANAMKALLIEQLGYRPGNVIVVKDAKRRDFVRLFGRRGNVAGEVQKRLKANPEARLMIYYSGHASSSGLGMDNYLLSVDAINGIEDKTAYSLNVLYDNLRELDARSTQLFLETAFNSNRSHMVLAPNIAERRVNVAPIVPVRGLTVFTAGNG